MDVVDEYAGEIRWELLRGLSSRAQLLVLGRLDSGMENILAMRWIDVLLRDGKPSLAGQIARRARKFSVRIGRPDHPLLLRWRTQESDDQKRALATALAAADMTDVVYSAAFAELFEEATARRTDASLRRAAFELLLRQAERRFGLHGFPAETENGGRGVSGRRTAGLRGCFPLRLGKGASDPLVEGLVRAAREDIDPQRFDALALLLAAGFVDEAEAVIREAKTAEDRNAALKRLMEHGHAADTYGLMAMLGGLIDKEDASSSRLILRYLDETAEKLPPSESWQLLASLRAGVRLDQLCELSFALGPTESPIASRWLCELGHMSRQDRQRLAAPGNAEDRMERLQRIDSRRACLVDGRYGVLVIVEVLVSEEQQHLEDRPIAGDDEGDSEEGADQRPAAKRCYRWQAPRRVTASLPSVLIASSDSDDSFKVMWGDRQIGEGVIVRDPRANRGPAELRPLLVSAGEALLGRGGWGWTVEGPLEQKETFRARLDQALGPALLCAAETGADTPPERRVMVLSVGQYLRSGLREAMGKIETKADPNKWVPQKLQLVLEYGAFGSYHGTGTRSPVPLARSAGKWHLHNVAMVLERID